MAGAAAACAGGGGGGPLHDIARGDWQQLVDCIAETLSLLHTTDFSAGAGINEAAVKAMAVSYAVAAATAASDGGGGGSTNIVIESEPPVRDGDTFVFPDLCVSLYADERRSVPPLLRAIIEFKYVRMQHVYAAPPHDHHCSGDGGSAFGASFVPSATHPDDSAAGPRSVLMVAEKSMRALSNAAEHALHYEPFESRQSATQRWTRPISDLCADAFSQAHRYAQLMHERDAKAPCVGAHRNFENYALSATNTATTTTFGYIVAYGPLVRSAADVLAPDTQPSKPRPYM